MAEVNIFVKVKDEASQAFGNISGAMEKTGQQAAAFAEKYKAQMRAVGAAMTAVGAIGLKLADDSRKMNAQLAQTGLTLGVATDDMRKLALQTTNVTFKLDSVIKTFEILARAGVRNTADMKASADAFDALADATGDTAENVAEMLIPAMKNLGVVLPQTSDELDNFTWLVKNTMVNLTDFQQAMLYVAAYGDDLTVTIEEMVAIMAALEAKGITGSAVTRVFRTAVSQAADGTVTLNDALGITQESVDGFTQEMRGAVGITDAYAEAANTQFGIMDKLKQKFDELKLRVGSLIEPFEGMFATMSSIGMLMMAMTVVTIPKLIAAIKGLGVAAMGVMSMLGPVLIAAGAAFGLYKLYSAFSGTKYQWPAGTTEEQKAATRAQYGLSATAGPEEIWQAQEQQRQTNELTEAYNANLTGLTDTVGSADIGLESFGESTQYATTGVRGLTKAFHMAVQDFDQIAGITKGHLAELRGYVMLGAMARDSELRALYEQGIPFPGANLPRPMNFTLGPWESTRQYLGPDVPGFGSNLNIQFNIDGQQVGQALVGPLGSLVASQMHISGVP